MTKEIENFVAVYRVINEMGPAIGDGRWEVFESLFTEDAALHHLSLGEVRGAKNIAAVLSGSLGAPLAAHYSAGNIRIDPSSGATAHAAWDFGVTLIYPDAGKDPLFLTAGSRLTAEFRHLGGRWLIADLTPVELWADPNMKRFVAARTAQSKG
ncbi:MAG: nuclear transport factor 2 family protein [Steroidobacteraceae bacterium]